MIVSDVIARIRSTFGDAAAVQVSDDDIIRWINDSQVEIVKHNDAALQTTGYVDLVAGQSTYTMPADLLILRSLRYKFSSMQSYSMLRYKNMQQFDETIDGWDGTLYGQGSPQFFTRYEDKVILFPTPEQANVNGLKILYNERPTDVIDSTSALALPILYHPTIVTYCMWQASLLDEDNEPALMYYNNFMSDMSKLINTETSDPVATYATITTRWDDL